MRAYFQYPWVGAIYSVDLDINDTYLGTQLVRLPDGECVKLEIKPKYYTRAIEASIGESVIQELPEARCIVAKGEASQRFTGEWGPLLEQIGAAAEANSLFEVILTPEEYARLKAEGLAALYAQLPKSASGLLHLYEEDPTGDGDEPVLELYRTCGGGCH